MANSRVKVFSGACLLLGSLACFSGCEGKMSHSQDGELRQPSLTSFDRNCVDRRVTSSSIALRNLSGEIDGLNAKRKRGILSEADRSRLLGLLLSRTQYLGQYSDFQQAELLVAEGEEVSEDAELLRAKLQLSLHQFEAAEVSLHSASDKGRDVTSEGRTLDLALHRHLQARLDESTAAFEANPNFGTLAERATLLAALGRYEEADAAYSGACVTYDDVSPFPLAWAAFQRGLMWSESAGRDDLGEVYYRQALELLPEYVVANVHLSELLQDDAEQLLLLERASKSEDPEPQGKLASLFAQSGDEKLRSQSQHYAEEGRMRYQKLLTLHRSAFLDHAAEFFMGPGDDSELAWELASENLSNRKNPRSYRVAIDAALTSGRWLQACELKEEAAVLAETHPVLAASILELNCEN